ncbi:MAG: G5 domain-containing protein [Clostridia bacterium]|nr:G5 domain-containing protein [Clostridia bacterium]
MTTQEKQKQRILRDIQKRREKKKQAQKRCRIIALATAITICTVTLGIVYEASAKEISLTEINNFDGTRETKTIKTRVSNVNELLEEEGINISEADKLNVPVHAEVNNNDEIILTRGKQVTIKTNQGEQVVNVTEADAADALVEAGYIPGEYDEISSEGDTIELIEVTHDEEIQKESIPHEVEYVEDSDLPEGETAVISEGQDGVKEIKNKVTYRNGEEVSREVISEEITVEPENRVIAKGTAKPTPVPEKKSASKTSSSSSVPVNDTAGTVNGMKYSKKITMTATAYSTSPSENGGYTVSAMGNPLGYGIVAVDPSVVPLGSKVYVTSADGSWTYGVASAEDTGGAIKGNKIDLCYNSSVSEVNQFGRRSCVVYILE